VTVTLGLPVTMIRPDSEFRAELTQHQHDVGDCLGSPGIHIHYTAWALEYPIDAVFLCNAGTDMLLPCIDRWYYA